MAPGAGVVGWQDKGSSGGMASVALCAEDHLERMELRLRRDEEPAESLWVRIKGAQGQGTVGVC